MNILKSAEMPLFMGVSVDFSITEALILIHFGFSVNLGDNSSSISSRCRVPLP